MLRRHPSLHRNWIFIGYRPRLVFRVICLKNGDLTAEMQLAAISIIFTSGPIDLFDFLLYFIVCIIRSITLIYREVVKLLPLHKVINN